jgi:2-C-methyl-D-erythritol 4-phosphate cytidylyltransferase
MAVALVVAAGQGERLGSERPKALVTVGGRPLYEWSVLALRASTRIEAIVLALPPGVPPIPGLLCVTGGTARSDSVRNALAAAPPAADPILIQDAARPLLTPELVDAVLAGLHGADAAIAAARVTDTTKECDDDHLVVRTLDRSRLWAVQTPQVFRRAALERALAGPPDEVAAATDEALLVERHGGRVRVVAAPRENLKVTTPLDLLVAEQLLALRPAD